MKFARFICLFALSAIATALAQTNPVPWVNQPLVPTATAPGGPSFKLTINGTGFVSGSVVNWNGTALTTTFVSSSQLTAMVPASNIATASAASITVSSPSPGGGISNLLFFEVSAPTDLKFASVPVTPPGTNDCLAMAQVVCANLVIADFTGDEKLDLTFDEFSPNFPSGLTSLGNGDGTFQAPVSSGASFNFSVAADFNGDGKPDQVGVGQGSSEFPYTAAIKLGNGNGTFSGGSTIASGTDTDLYGYQVAAGDFNGDGKLDVAVGDNLGIEVYLGNGDGTFQTGLPPVGGGTAFAQTVGDFNGDGKLDIAEIVGTGPNYQLQILLGNGDGTFQTGASYPGFTSSDSEIFAADLNGDDKLDLVVFQIADTPQGTGSMAVLLGNGDGTFGTAKNYPVSGSLGGGAIADFNADGKLDVMLSNSTNTVPSTTTMLGNGDGSFQSPLVLSVPANGSVAAGDFNNDGKMDLAAATANGLVVLLQDYASDFSLTAGSSTLATVTPGQTANYTVNVVPQDGFNQSVSLTSSGAPAQSTCTVSPSSVTLNGKPVPVMVSVVTTAGAMGLTQPLKAPPISGTFSLMIALSGFLGLLIVATLSGRHRAPRPQLALGETLVCLLSIGLTMSACGGGNGNGGGGNGGTQAGTYTLTVAGTSTSGSTTLSHKTNLTLVVQ